MHILANRCTHKPEFPDEHNLIIASFFCLFVPWKHMAQCDTDKNFRHVALHNFIYVGFCKHTHSQWPLYQKLFGSPRNGLLFGRHISVILVCGTGKGAVRKLASSIQSFRNTDSERKAFSRDLL